RRSSPRRTAPTSARCSTNSMGSAPASASDSGLARGKTVVVVDVMLGNAAVAAGLALLALAAGYFCRCPALRHAAWLVVLLKLVTPPLFPLSLPVLPASWNAPIAEATSVHRIVFSAPS